MKPFWLTKLGCVHCTLLTTKLFLPKSNYLFHRNYQASKCGASTPPMTDNGFKGNIGRISNAQETQLSNRLFKGNFQSVARVSNSEPNQ